MKKVLFAIVAVAGIACACTKDLEDRVGVLEKKVAALEEAVNTNADAISELKTAAANSVAIASVEKKDGYYEIKFANEPPQSFTIRASSESRKSTVSSIGLTMARFFRTTA